jgi:hypothetical protein
LETGKTNLGWEVKFAGLEAGDTLIAIGSAVKFAVVLAKWIVKHTLDQATPLGFASPGAGLFQSNQQT